MCAHGAEAAALKEEGGAGEEDAAEEEGGAGEEEEEEEEAPTPVPSPSPCPSPCPRPFPRPFAADPGGGGPRGREGGLGPEADAEDGDRGREDGADAVEAGGGDEERDEDDGEQEEQESDKRATAERPPHGVWTRQDCQRSGRAGRRGVELEHGTCASCPSSTAWSWSWPLGQVRVLVLALVLALVWSQSHHAMPAMAQMRSPRRAMYQASPCGSLKRTQGCRDRVALVESTTTLGRRVEQSAQRRADANASSSARECVVRAPGSPATLTRRTRLVCCMLCAGLGVHLRAHPSKLS